MSLESVRDEGEIIALKKDLERSGVLLRAIAARVGLDPATVEVVAEGSALVGATPDRILKVFAPFDAAYARTEGRVLRFLEGALPVATPRLHAEEAVEGWSAIVMERLPGRPWRAVADAVDPAARPALHRAAGSLTRALHALDPAPVADLPPSWTSWIETQRTGAVARQRSLGLPAEWLDRIEPFLSATDADRTAHEGAPVLLHTELMRDHLLVAPDADGVWRITGLIDFEPSMVGAAEYDLASVGLFVGEGDPGAFGHFLEGYGLGGDALQGSGAGAGAAGVRAALARRAFSYALLHRYAHLPWYLTLPAARGATSLEELAERFHGSG